MNQGFSEVEGKLSREIAALFDLGVSELKDRWRSVYGTEPPPRSSRKLLASASGPRHHRLQVVGTSVLRFEKSHEGGVSWNALNLLFNGARCTLGNLPRRASSRTSILCRLSAKPVKHLSKAS